MMIARLAYSLELPSNFRLSPFLDFYQRDPQQVAESVDKQNKCLSKGMMWGNQPACLYFDFSAFPKLNVSLEAKTPFPAEAENHFVSKINKMLGLNQAIELFETTHATHSELGPIIQKNSGLRVPVTATPFEALTWAIIGQQISLKAAISLRRKWIQAIGQQYHDHLWCYPDAKSALHLNLEQLRQLGFSYAKARTLLTVSHLVQTEQLPLEQWEASPAIETMSQTLLNVPGIGPWTVNYTLLRGFGWLDGALHTDGGMQRALKQLQGTKTTNAQAWLMQFSPWRALATAHLWHYATQATQ